MNTKPVFVYKGEALASYNFGEKHPFGPLRHAAFHDALALSELASEVTIMPPAKASVDHFALIKKKK